MKLISKIINFLQRYNKEQKPMSFDDICLLLEQKKDPIIFDVGANAGQSIIRFKKLFPNSTIHSFEPLEKECNSLLLKYKNDNSITINNFALGDKAERKDFYISALGTNSSFEKTKLKTIQNLLKTRKELFGISDDKYIKKIKKTEIQTLDFYCERNNINKIDILKIDTPGYEDKVIAGATKLLSTETAINILQTDIMFDKVFEKSMSFFDIEKHLIKNNFRLIALKTSRYKNVFEGYKFSASLLYQNKKFIE